MRVLHISTTDGGGAGMCSLRIHQSLLAAGISSKYLVLHNTQHAKEEYEFGYYRNMVLRAISKLLRAVHLTITQRNKVEYLARQNDTTYTLPVSGIDITKCELVDWADIIHLHWVNGYVDYPSFFKNVKKPIVWTLHDENLFYGIAHLGKKVLESDPLELKYREIKRESVKAAQNITIVFLSQMMRKRFSGEDIIARRKSVVINNSVDTELFRPYDREKMRQKYGIDFNKEVCVFIAMNIADSNKNLDMLSRVLFEENPNAIILAIGSNPSGREWVNVRTLGLLKDPVDISKVLSCADYMAMPSYQEAFSQCPMEAMACGIPVVAFPVSGTVELINDTNGVVCVDFTKESLKAGIHKIKSSEYDANVIRQGMIDKFSPGAIAQQYISLYNEII